MPASSSRMISGVQRSARISVARATGQYWPYSYMAALRRLIRFGNCTGEPAGARFTLCPVHLQPKERAMTDDTNTRRDVLQSLAALGLIGIWTARPRTAAAQAAGLTPGKVDTKGLTAKIKYESPLAGYLTDLNGRYKLRVTELVLEPGGYVGEHHHAGPGIRQVTSGYMAYVMPDKSPGDFFFRVGRHHAYRDEQDGGADGARAVRDSACRPQGAVDHAGEGEVRRAAMRHARARGGQSQASARGARWLDRRPASRGPRRTSGPRSTCRGLSSSLRIRRRTGVAFAYRCDPG